jgi:hypothetical protein
MWFICTELELLFIGILNKQNWNEIIGLNEREQGPHNWHKLSIGSMIVLYIEIKIQLLVLGSVILTVSRC